MDQMEGSSTSPQRFRWRTLPVAFVCFIAFFFFIAGVFSFFVMTYTTWTGRPLYKPGPSGFSKEGLAVGIGGIVFGIWLFWTSSLWWRGRWWRAILMIAACIAAAQAGLATGLLPE
jgi:hypothetical protein